MTFLNVIKHAFVSGKPDGSDATVVRPSNWNAEHNVDMSAAENTLLGSVTGSGGAITDIPLGVGMKVVGGQLTALLSMPIGAILDYGGGNPPAGWLYCDGAAVSRTTYSALYAVIHTSFGIGDGVTTFNTPDLRGRVTAGREGMGPASPPGRLTSEFFGGPTDTEGSAGGAQSHVLTIEELAAHDHTFDDDLPGETGPAGEHSHRMANSNTTGGSATATPDGNMSYKNTSGVAYELSTSTGVPTILLTGVADDHTHTVGTAGEDEPHMNIQPTMIVTKIIYAGV